MAAAWTTTWASSANSLRSLASRMSPYLAHSRIVVERSKRNRLVMKEAVEKYQFVVFRQALGQVGTDETRAASNENGLVSDSYALFLGRFLRNHGACAVDAVSVGFWI